MPAPALLRSPTVRTARRRLAVVRQTGRWRPDHIRLVPSGQEIYVDPRDARGWEIVRGLGRGHQPALIALWTRAVAELEPSLAVDVGANYGELLLSARYPVGCLAHAVEANPRVVPALRRSIAAHPDAGRIALHPCLAGRHDGGSATLQVDPAWSGTAATALAQGRDGRPLVAVDVAVRTVDALVGNPELPGPVVAKVDTEGAEPDVLAGMATLLARAPAVVAIVEFDPEILRRAGADPAALFAALRAIGRCWSITWAGETAPAETPPTEATDLVVASDPGHARQLGLALA